MASREIVLRFSARRFWDSFYPKMGYLTGGAATIGAGMKVSKETLQSKQDIHIGELAAVTMGSCIMAIPVGMVAGLTRPIAAPLIILYNMDFKVKNPYFKN